MFEFFLKIQCRLRINIISSLEVSLMRKNYTFFRVCIILIKAHVYKLYLIIFKCHIFIMNTPDLFQ